MKTIDIFIVTFYSDLNILAKVLQRLNEAMRDCSGALFRVTLIDNSYGKEQDYFGNLKDFVAGSEIFIKLHQSPKNLGFGRANNLAFEISSKSKNGADYILVLNPDVFLSVNSLSMALRVFREFPDLGVLLPRFFSEAGEDLYLAKQYPSIWMLFLRGFAPNWMRKLFKSSLDFYDLKHFPVDKQHLKAVVGSGACFFMKRDIWEILNGFDERFFLYFEDFDLIYRARKVTKVTYEPSITTIHLGGHAATKGSKHIRYFLKSAVQFFSKERLEVLLNEITSELFLALHNVR